MQFDVTLTIVAAAAVITAVLLLITVLCVGAAVAVVCMLVGAQAAARLRSGSEHILPMPTLAGVLAQNREKQAQPKADQPAPHFRPPMSLQSRPSPGNQGAGATDGTGRDGKKP